MKVMIVEDEPTIRKLLGDSIKKYNFDVHSLEDFNDVLGSYLKEKPHIILLDINLPIFDGFYWCDKIREISQVPIIFVSSRGTPMDMVMAMNMGGDDYIQKPFDMEVVIAKISALLRRTYSYVDKQPNVLEHKGIILNVDSWNISCKDENVELTKTEFIILQLLMQNKGSIVSRNKMMRRLWKDENFVDDNTLTVNINRLRKKIAQLSKEEFITTKKGEGYIIL
ncbi:response regulator transcription factor [Thalassobacillus pellis]|uniref:response regulator transcription factor n=1 Tax=Thalassobacillus pellis TaxID=748008 RepID=UPI00196031DA|nr:response regulator transcription factor [Thalassobacillus pellis]MBM7553437.1 DNA-binding response OmpR family regulator [Thalassobacillus pellis]